MTRAKAYYKMLEYLNSYMTDLQFKSFQLDFLSELSGGEYNDFMTALKWWKERHDD